ncbi:NAD-dependent epimerase/dehydratase family protein [Candidatus Nomurabacteria bacterium]|nr:NAD-dependent epimerase/dehydratase family protein [Candidatus Nomurabacteria bacterium]
MIKKKKFVTGATGYVGQHLVNSLLEKGYQVYILTRKESPIFSNNKNINIIIGDITDPINLPPDVDTIYHCAGVIYQLKELERVNVLGTKNIVETALRNNCQLIHLSSAGAINPHNAYEWSKYRGEKIVLDGIKIGLKARILRPTTIFGPGKNKEGSSFLELIKSMRSGAYKNIGQGIYNIVHIDEVVKAMIQLSEADIPYGGVYLINNPIAFKDMDILVKNLPPAITKKTKTIPYPVACLAALILTLISFITRRKNPLTFSRIKALTNTLSYSQNKIVEAIHFKNTLPIEEYIKKVCLNLFMQF